ncbi:MAG: AAA family ATPase [Nitriliruptorales bacterium]|nr:AAA family ATPase [Nitriliruptorales bacterium]
MTDAVAERLTGAEELAGEVAGVVFVNEASGFGVIEFVPNSPDDQPPRAAGPLAGLHPGQSVRLVGRWTEHERYGPTFEATYYEQARPRSAEGLVAFLASPRFPRVGPTLAQRMVATFGLELGTVLEREPHRLTQVRGVSADLAHTIGEAWRTAGALASLVERLGAVGVPVGVAQAAHRHFGDEADDTLADDPYALLQVRGTRWGHAETLARSAGLEQLDTRRLVAAAVTAQRESCAAGGHTTLDTAGLISGVRRLLGTEVPPARRALQLAVDRRLLAREEVAAEEGGPQPAWAWYLPEDLAAERHLAEDLARLVRARSRVRASAGDVDPDPELTAEQRAAVEAALNRPVSVLTGGPGTGKTRTVLEVVRACEARGLNVALCAPTGRAAKRLEELTSRAATTIHRLLEARGGPSEGFRFGYDAKRRLPHDMIIADEWSMADARLARALIRAIGDGAHVLLVGDGDQLPSVGPGAVLRDLLSPKAAALVEATRLTRIHRQAAESRIVTLAHEVNSGAPQPYTPGRPARDGDVFAVPEGSEAVAERVAAIVGERAPAYFDCTPAEVQVLAPMYRGPAGVDALNAALKARLNPPAGRPPVAGFHEGDRVVQTRNDADLEVANGDIGEVVATDRTARTLEVAFPWGTVMYEGERAGDLAPAWCLTVHKAQGGEWPVVVLVLDPGHRIMLARELVYTALTRAARGLLLVGSPELLAAAARRTGLGARQRRTGLAERLARVAAAEDGDGGKDSAQESING